jgi:3-isopropylmalate dehydrogenase
MSRRHRHTAPDFEQARHSFPPLLTGAMPDWCDRSKSSLLAAAIRPVIGVLPGEGIGPEVTAAAVDVLRALEASTGHTFDIRYGGPIGNAAEKETGKPLTHQVVRFCKSVFADGGAILCGAGGGRFVYELRAQFDLFCKFTPISPLPVLLNTGAVRSTARQGVDLIVVRENMGGAYFGQGSSQIGADGLERVRHTFDYSTGQIARILSVAIRLANLRRGSLTLVVKRSGVPAVSELWAKLFTELTAGEGFDTLILEADNAAYQLIAAAHNFDVIVAPNMLGDILSDLAGVLLASRGLSFSGNFGNAGIAVYQTGHGAAYDLAGRNVANPVGQIHSAAMLLRESFGLVGAAATIEAAVVRTLAAGFRTADLAVPGSTVVGTREFAQRVADAIESESSKVAVAS